MTYKTIHTTYGLAAMAAAESSGIPINLTEMAVGDGAGGAVTPAESQTALVNEVYRAAVNRVYQDPVITTKFTAELVIPASEAGFTLREVGIFDAGGNLFAVGNLPATYKPNVSEGSFADTVVRMEFLVTNADVVTVIADTETAVATQAWVLSNVTVCSLLPGGTAGQVLRKASNTCGDAEWANPDDVNVVVDIVEEQQTLTTSQTQVDWLTVTTNGLSVYIEGVRIPNVAGADGWQVASAPDDLTSIVLGKSYPDGTKIVGVQNEPLGTITEPLAKDQNLADLPSAAAARTNLDVYSKSEVDQRCPPGMVAYYARDTAPTGWLKANGAAVSRTTYAALFAAIGTTYGAGNGTTTFNLPDLRGEFIRGWDDARGVDFGRAFGSTQADETKEHYHLSLKSGISNDDLTAPTGFGATHPYPVQQRTTASASNYEISGSATEADIGKTSSVGGSETRPRNVALLPVIKY